MNNSDHGNADTTPDTADVEASPGDIVSALVDHLRLLALGPLAAGIIALGVTYLIAPVYTARTSFLPPQQAQSVAASALASLGSLGNLVGGGVRTPADQYVALLQSTTVADRLIDRFSLIQVYDKEFRQDARRELARLTRSGAGKKDGLIVLEFDDPDPARAAAIANQYVEELRLLTNRLALTDAQQRRAFFENQVAVTRNDLRKAQSALQASGFTADSLKAEPKAAAEGYAKAKAELTSARARLDALRRGLTDNAPEVQQAEAAIDVLRGQLERLESSSSPVNSADYIGRYREYKYQEVLFEQFSRQFELARLDEAREGLLQVVDVAQAPERKTWPKRGLIGAVVATAALVTLLAWILATERLRRPGGYALGRRLRAGFGRR